jgi:hypothetical protein
LGADETLEFFSLNVVDFFSFNNSWWKGSSNELWLLAKGCIGGKKEMSKLYSQPSRN